jgi:hypothetical protein
MTYLYLQPEPTIKTGITGVLIIILIAILAMNYLHIYLNWDVYAVKCKVENVYLAYITGNMKNWWEKCGPK